MKIAVITTVFFPLSHADVIVTRWVNPFYSDPGYGWAKPTSVISSVFIEQRPANDIGGRFCSENGIPLRETIEEALTLGTGRLAVDAVLIIGEHGEYPHNEFRQKLYPRKRLFDEVVRVFRACGRTVPVFNDKHFSWDFTESAQMLETAREMGFPLWGGSSLPHHAFVPVHPLAEGGTAREGLGLFFDSLEAYGYHSLELVQSFVEKRGETGVRAVRALEGDAVRSAVAAGDVPADLLLAALTCHGYPHEAGVVPFLMERVESPVLFQVEHVDGLRTHHLFLPKFVQNFVVALRLDHGAIRAGQVAPGGAGQFFPTFATLNGRVETFFQTGHPPTNPLRTHLAAGVLQAALQTLGRDDGWRETPGLCVSYDNSDHKISPR